MQNVCGKGEGEGARENMNEYKKEDQARGGALSFPLYVESEL